MRRLRNDTDVRFAINPLVKTQRSLLSDLLVIVARRRGFAVGAPRGATPVAVGSDELMQRLSEAGLLAGGSREHTDGRRKPDATLPRERAAEAWNLPLDRRWALHLCAIRNRRDAVTVAGSLKRALMHATRSGSRPLLVVAGPGSGDPFFRRLVSRVGSGDDIRLLGDVTDPTVFLAAPECTVTFHDIGSRPATRRSAARGPSRLVPNLRHRTLVLGGGAKAQELMALLADHRSSREVVGVLVAEGAVSSMLGCPVLGTVDNLFRVAEEAQIQSIVVALDHDSQYPTETLFDLKTMGVEIVECRHLLEQISGRIYIDHITPYRVIFSKGFRRPRTVLALKRTGDFALAGVGLVALAPVFAVLGLLIRLDTRGPIFYRQLRIGFNGRPFSIWKFRSMRVDAECQHAPVWAAAADPRITRIGRWMRTWRLDELPQLINVLRGEMSLVGPRPERPVFVQELRREVAYYDVRHTVPPGITGWAQVRFPYASSMEESYQKLQYDLYYVKHMSLRLDFRIAAETLRVMVRGEGAR